MKHVLLICFLLACSTEEHGAGALNVGGLLPVDEVDGTPVFVLSSLDVSADYYDDNEYVVSCSVTSEKLFLSFIDIETGTPKIPIDDEYDNPDIRCDSAIVWPNGIEINCSRHVISSLFNWDDHFSLFLNRDIYSKKLRGTITWTVDGGEYFWCVRHYQTTDVVEEYVIE